MRTPTYIILGSIFLLGLLAFISSMMALDNHINNGDSTDYKPAKSIVNFAKSIIRRDQNKTAGRADSQAHWLNISSATNYLRKHSYSSETGDYTFPWMNNDKHPAVPDPAYAPKHPKAATSCQKSFEPVCDMYNYVRFWNKRFIEPDCYKSPLSPALGSKAPYSQQKYVVFQPDGGGWNNIRMAAETAMIFAHTTGRTLVMPPTAVWYLLTLNKKNHQENKSNFDKFFDLNKVREAMNIITMEEFIENVAMKGLLKIPPPINN
eukprot:gene4121-8192_t